MSSTIRNCALAVGTLALACASCAQQPRQAILVTIDSLRDDHVGPDGRGHTLTPQLDRLRADSVRFSDAITSATTTLASHASMLTGLRPHHHGLQGNDGSLPPNVLTLAAQLRARRIPTGAVVSSFVLRSEGGLGSGFDTYDEAFNSTEQGRIGQKVKSPATTTRVALEWIQQHRSRSFFLWVHYFPPHGPYTPPEEFLSGLQEPDARTPAQTLPSTERSYERGKLPKYQRIEGVSDARIYRSRYAGHVRYVDQYVGQLMAGLREMGIYDRALVVAAADHGESLGEHGWFFCHGNLVYGEQARVPLIVKWPSREQRVGVTCSAPVELVDLAPTVLRFFGERPKGALDGQNLEDLLADPSAATRRPRVVQSTDGELVAVLAGGWKLTQRHPPTRLVDKTQPWLELFRIDRDPGELADAASRHPDIVKLLTRLLPREQAAVPQRGLSQETREQLHQLGYVEAASPRP